MKNTIIRVLTGVPLLGGFFLLVWYEPLHLGFSIIIALLASIGLAEYFYMVGSKSIGKRKIGALIACFIIVFSGHFNSLPISNLCFFLGVIAGSYAAVAYGKDFAQDMVQPVFGLLYVAWCAMHFNLLRAVPEGGVALVLLVVLVVAANDVAAYFGGRALGRHKLAPQISPGKTIEGALTGILAAMVSAAILGDLRPLDGFTGMPDWPRWGYALAGAALAIAGILGDLAESYLKRDAGVKDSGWIFPGHGGVLDRCDGFLFAGPVLYYMALVA